ncbi:MAG: RyR domain-containing protein [Thermodesulfovibrionales bacterium]|nr:RyR domain-containing protein [Thermodesulfovibrionales bacterium]
MSEDFILDEQTLEKLAAIAHQVWMEGKIRDGWRQGDVIDKVNKIHTCLVPYEQLSEADKESDRDMVRGIPRILDMAGYKIVKK